MTKVGTAAALTVPAPAKLNLFLHVNGRRDDGYHLLESLMVLIDLADTVRIERRDDGRIELPDPLPGVAVEADLAYRAARALQQHANAREGATIRVTKRIPLGAGLGGGSSDAASVLLALNRLWGLELPRAELMRVALTLGADVPFFVFGSNARVTGIGEVLERVTISRTDFLLATTAVGVATASIFAAPELVRDTPLSGGRAFVAGFGRNDLQPVALARNPGIAAAIEALERISTVSTPGWPQQRIRMTGSGSTVFKMGWPDRFDSIDPADRHARAGPNRRTGAAFHDKPEAIRLIRTRSLACHPLREFVAK